IGDGAFRPVLRQVLLEPSFLRARFFGEGRVLRAGEHRIEDNDVPRPKIIAVVGALARIASNAAIVRKITGAARCDVFVIADSRASSRFVSPPRPIITTVILRSTGRIGIVAEREYHSIRMRVFGKDGIENPRRPLAIRVWIEPR